VRWSSTTDASVAFIVQAYDIDDAKPQPMLGSIFSSRCHSEIESTVRSDVSVYGLDLDVSVVGQIIPHTVTRIGLKAIRIGYS
jgi:hypothetical protein